MSGDSTSEIEPEGDDQASGTRLSVELAAEDLVYLTRDAAMTVEITPATGSRLKGSHWVAELKELDAWASALGLEETLEALALSAVGAAHELIAGEDEGREAALPVAVRVLALDRLDRLVPAFREAEVVSGEFERSVLPAKGGFATELGQDEANGG